MRTFTCDALNTQKETVKAVIRGQGDYVAALKENQKLLYENVKDYFDEEQKKHLRKTPKKYKKTIEKAHSCVETRYSLLLDFEEEISRIFSLLNVEKIESMVK